MIARLQFELAVDDDLVVRSEPGIDESLAAPYLGDGDRLHFGKPCRRYNPRVRAIWPLLDRGRRYRQRIQPRFEKKPCINKLSRPELAILVRKLCLDLQRAGLLVDLVIHEQQLALSKLILLS